MGKGLIIRDVAAASIVIADFLLGHVFGEADQVVMKGDDDTLLGQAADPLLLVFIQG